MKLDHVGIIVKHARQMEQMVRLLGLREVGRGRVDRYDAECVMFEGLGIRLECIFADSGPLAEYNNGRGGLHHLAVELEPGEELSEELSEGLPLLEESAVQGICGMLVNFVHPLFAGLPIEVVERERVGG